MAVFSSLWAQEEAVDTVQVVPLTVQVGRVAYNGDSIPHVILPTLYKYPPPRRSEKEQKRYNQLVLDVKKVLPLAKRSRVMLIETYELLVTLPEEERAAHIKAVEEGLKREYAPVLRRVNRRQGRILVKLIDRECNQTGYHIAKAFLGTFRANFYQGFALLFGQSLNKHYDPEGDDKEIERVVRMVESGQL